MGGSGGECWRGIASIEGKGGRELGVWRLLRLVCSNGDSVGRVLDGLNFKYEREPDWCSVGDQGADEGAVGDELGLLGAIPVSPSQGLHESF